jgi:hypothetical protein
VSVKRVRQVPAEFEVAGPWDGTAESFAELRAFVSRTGTDLIRHHERTRDALEISSTKSAGWVTLQLGHSLLMDRHGVVSTIGPVALEIGFMPVESLGVIVE